MHDRRIDTSARITSMKIYPGTYPTTPGWYCIGWDRNDLQDQENFGPDLGPIYRFDGAAWFNESNEIVKTLCDPILGIEVAMDAAEYYIPQ